MQSSLLVHLAVALSFLNIGAYALPMTHNLNATSLDIQQASEAEPEDEMTKTYYEFMDDMTSRLSKDEFPPINDPSPYKDQVTSQGLLYRVHDKKFFGRFEDLLQSLGEAVNSGKVPTQAGTKITFRDEKDTTNAGNKTMVLSMLKEIDSDLKQHDAQSVEEHDKLVQLHTNNHDVSVNTIMPPKDALSLLGTTSGSYLMKIDHPGSLFFDLKSFYKSPEIQRLFTLFDNETRDEFHLDYNNDRMTRHWAAFYDSYREGSNMGWVSTGDILHPQLFYKVFDNALPYSIHIRRTTTYYLLFSYTTDIYYIPMGPGSGYLFIRNNFFHDFYFPCIFDCTPKRPILYVPRRRDKVKKAFFIKLPYEAYDVIDDLPWFPDANTENKGKN
ncbi:hypothetical protein WICPIJ_001811 [Wickerhamomyces pijperi]|uniref:Uncharacterized protein n=1 Tax=Wickerhamomyces pijperi TaxID=599730 RepID=A0A9P8TQS9_WICPI|nr:hypothetical protein WICPIJ_001811 [Wickerhamomyces pijperi]